MRLLMDGGAISPEPPEDDDQRLDELILACNCVAIAGRLGLDHGYVFDQVSYGPHSDRLCDEIEGAAARAWAGRGGDAPPLPAGFDADRLVRLLAGKDADWIMAASYLIVFSHSRPDTEALAELVGYMTAGRSPEYCRSIVREMTSPEIGIVLDCDRFVHDDPWRPALASAARSPAAPLPAAAEPAGPAAAG